LSASYAAAYIYIPLNCPGASATFPRGLNDAGTIVGTYTDASGVSHGFVATPGESAPVPKPTILWRNTSTGENHIWYMNWCYMYDGSLSLGGEYLSSLSDQNWQIVGTIDFSVNEPPWILWRNNSTGENAICYRNGSTCLYLMTVNDQNWQIMGKGDFNDDGRKEILWRNTSTGENTVWYMNGITITGVDYLPPVGHQNWSIVGPK